MDKEKYDPRFPNGRASERRHQKKSPRGVHGPPRFGTPPKAVRQVPILVQKRRRIFLTNTQKLRAVEQFEDLAAVIRWEEAMETFKVIFR